ncbi:MAG TPA: hypothetical protein PKD61_07465, partial [Polyangiaceae bacterium]|nr:hypothetical protein [Polyangiaceae bacterium]
MRNRTFRRAVTAAALCSATLYAGAAGAQSLVPGPGEANHDSALLQKMGGYERQVHGILSLPLGWGLEGFVPPSQRSVVEGFISTGQSDFKAAT